jgi:zeaxanthin glucosyltransferase
MAHLGLICPELSGRLNPMTTLGRELKRRGHRVTLIGRPDAQKKTESAGLEFAVVGEKEFPVGALAKTSAQLGRLECAAIYRGTPAAWRGHHGRPSIGCDRENGC